MKMNPIGFFADLMTSKYFLLFIALISSINIVGYISMGYIDAVMLFAMVAYLTFVFSKNMTVVLLVAVIIVNLYMSNMFSREGATSSQKGSSNGAPLQAGGEVGNLEAMTNKKKEGLNDVKNTMPDDENIEMEEPDTETTEEVEVEEDEEEVEVPKKKTIKEGIKRKSEGMGNIEPAPIKGGNSHIDYGTTLSDAYRNLEDMLGEDGLKSLTADTKKLMEQQSKLFNSMENIAPLLAQAQKLMEGMGPSKKEGFSNSRVGGSGFADNAEVIGKSSN
jgi:hypothetical protein